MIKPSSRFESSSSPIRRISEPQGAGEGWEVLLGEEGKDPPSPSSQAALCSTCSRFSFAWQTRVKATGAGRRAVCSEPHGLGLFSSSAAAARLTWGCGPGSGPRSPHLWTGGQQHLTWQ